MLRNCSYYYKNLNIKYIHIKVYICLQKYQTQNKTANN